MAEGSVALAAIGLGVALIKILDYLIKRSDKTIEANTKAGQAQAKAIGDLSGAVVKLNTSITDRDKRDREFHTNVMKSFEYINSSLSSLDEKADRNYEVVANMQVLEQNVEHQTVEHRDGGE